MEKSSVDQQRTPGDTRIRPIALTVAFYALLVGGLYSTGFIFSNGWPNIDASPQRALLYRINFLALPIAVTFAVVHIAVVICTSSNRRIRSENHIPVPPNQERVSVDPENPGEPRNSSLEYAILAGVCSGVVLSALFAVFIFTNHDPEAGMALIALPWFFAIGSIVGFLVALFICRK